MRRFRQAGLTLVEFMVAIAIGMLLIAAVATLIAEQSSTRADLDKSGRMIENGRYAVRTIAEDAQLAGYWGEMSTITATGATPDPCSTALSDLESAMGVHVQGYDGAGSTFPSCISFRKAGTDVLVIRRADPDTSDVLTAGAMDFAKVKEGQVYLQTGLDSSGVQFAAIVAAGRGVASTDASTFNLKKKDKTTVAPLRKYVVHIYYVSSCSVQVSSSCTNGDGGSPIPTLKRVDLTYSGTSVAMSSPITIAEGIENLQVEYGTDTDADGSPDSFSDGSTIANAPAWHDVTAVKVHLLARAAEATAGYQDTKNYTLAGNAAYQPNDGYKRHLFVNAIRLANPIMRRNP